MRRTPRIPLIAVVGLIASVSFSSSSALKQMEETAVPRIQLEPEVAQCIRDKKPWSECYKQDE